MFAICFAAFACRSTLPILPGPVPERACAVHASLTDSVFLIGDAGAPRLARGGSAELVDPVLLRLQAEVVARAAELGEQHTLVLFLGDNLYPTGLPPEGSRRRAHRERVLDALIASVGPARAYFVAGNHDWGNRSDRGWDTILEQRAFFEAYAPRIRTAPLAGCAGPERVDVGRHLRLIFMDPIGWTHALAFPDEHASMCSRSDSLEIGITLAREFARPDGRHVVLALHHPIVTAGPHGGDFTWKQHLFPLTDFWSWAWLPLPGVGSAYPISRKLGVTTTDLASRPYHLFTRAFWRISRLGAPMLVVAGHEHSLQVHRDIVGLYYAVSGAGSTSKVNRVGRSDTMLLGRADPGFMRLDVFEEGALELTVHTLDEEEPVYRHCLADGPFQDPLFEDAATEFSPGLPR